MGSEKKESQKQVRLECSHFTEMVPRVGWAYL